MKLVRTFEAWMFKMKFWTLFCLDIWNNTLTHFSWTHKCCSIVENVRVSTSLNVYPPTIYGAKYSRMDQVKFVEDSLYKVWRVWSALGRLYPVKIFEGCLPQILLGPFLNTLSHTKCNLIGSSELNKIPYFRIKSEKNCRKHGKNISSN